MSWLRRRLVFLLVGGVASAAGIGQAAKPSDRALRTEDGDTVVVTEDARAAAMRYSPSVAAADRVWIEAAVARARPEAARLIAEVDGMVTLGVLPSAGDGTLGVTSGGPQGFTVDLDFTALNDHAALDRATVVLHELGHVIDFALVTRDLGVTLDEQIPRGGPCGLAAGCDALEERFADTFAKWALNGAVSQAGAGYGIPMPASLESWGAPLGALALSIGD
jgi:hypothetical protein